MLSAAGAMDNLIEQKKLFATTSLTVAENMRKKMAKQVVADGLPKPVCTRASSLAVLGHVLLTV